MPERLLILNPGSTSTKAAVYDGTRPLFSRSIPHSNQDFAPFPTLNDQLDYRVALVRGVRRLHGARVEATDLRGGGALAVAALGAEERQIILLHAVTGLKHREIAALMELPLATVLSKYHRGLKKMRAQLEGDETP